MAKLLLACMYSLVLAHMLALFLSTATNVVDAEPRYQKKAAAVNKSSSASSSHAAAKNKSNKKKPVAAAAAPAPKPAVVVAAAKEKKMFRIPLTHKPMFKSKPLPAEGTSARKFVDRATSSSKHASELLANATALLNSIKIKDDGSGLETEPLINDQNLYYTNLYGGGFSGPVGVGTPNQILLIDFFLTSADLVIPSCSMCSSLYISCTDFDIPRYNDSLSSTYVPIGTPITINYISYDDYFFVSGFLSQDSITLYPGTFTITNQIFTEETQALGGIFLQPGTAGLALPEKSISGAPPLVLNAYNEGLISEPVFAVYLDPNPDRFPNGELQIGGSDPTLYSPPMTYVNVSKPGYWEFKLDRILFGSTSYCHDCEAIAAMEVPCIIGPDDAINAINNIIYDAIRVSHSFHLAIRKNPQVLFDRA